MAFAYCYKPDKIMGLKNGDLLETFSTELHLEHASEMEEMRVGFLMQAVGTDFDKSDLAISIYGLREGLKMFKECYLNHIDGDCILCGCAE